MSHLMRPAKPVPGGPTKDSGYWWGYEDSTRPEYPFTTERLDQLRQIAEDDELELAWIKLLIEVINVLKLRVSCAHCQSPHSMKDAEEAKAVCVRHYNWIRDTWMVLGTSRIHPVHTRGTLLDTTALAEVVGVLKMIENLVIPASETVACRRGIRDQSGSWLPWDETNGADRLRRTN